MRARRLWTIYARARRAARGEAVRAALLVEKLSDAAAPYSSRRAGRAEPTLDPAGRAPC